jgi:hypothetical protein
MIQKRAFGIIAVVIVYIVVNAALINFYGNAATIVSAMASVALVIVTAALVVATFTYSAAANRQAEATNRQAAALTNPVLFFGVEEFETSMVLQFFVQNVGPGIAYDVNFEVIKDSESAILMDNKRLSDLAFINSPLKTLAPGQKITFAIINFRQKNLSKETIEVEVSYKNELKAKERLKQRFPIDFAYIEGMRQVRPPSIPDSVKKIAEGVAALKNN